METRQAIESRTSCRAFKAEPVPRQTIENLIDAGRKAPSANNLQPIEFVVVTNANVLRSIAVATDYGRFIMEAPACIVIVARNTKYYLEDGCAAVENILIAASDSGLGACWVAGDKKPYANKILNIIEAPANYNLIALVPVGWPQHTKKQRDKKPLAKVLHWENF